MSLRKGDSVSLYPLSLAENTYVAVVEGIKQMGSCCPWALGHHPFAAAPAPHLRVLPAGPPGAELCDGHLLGKLPTPQLWNLAMAELSAFRIGFYFNTCTYTRNHLIKDAV